MPTTIRQHLDNAVGYTTDKYSKEPVYQAGRDLKEGWFYGGLEAFGDIKSGAHPIRGTFRMIFNPFRAVGYTVKACLQDLVLGGSHKVISGRAFMPDNAKEVEEQPEVQK